MGTRHPNMAAWGVYICLVQIRTCIHPFFMFYFFFKHYNVCRTSSLILYSRNNAENRNILRSGYQLITSRCKQYWLMHAVLINTSCTYRSKQYSLIQAVVIDTSRTDWCQQYWLMQAVLIVVNEVENLNKLSYSRVVFILKIKKIIKKVYLRNVCQSMSCGDLKWPRKSSKWPSKWPRV